MKTYHALTAIKEVEMMFVNSDRPHDIGSAHTQTLEPTGIVDAVGSELACRQITSVIAKPRKNMSPVMKELHL